MKFQIPYMLSNYLILSCNAQLIEHAQSNMCNAVLYTKISSITSQVFLKESAPNGSPSRVSLTYAIHALSRTPFFKGKAQRPRRLPSKIRPSLLPIQEKEKKVAVLGRHRPMVARGLSTVTCAEDKEGRRKSSFRIYS